MAAAGALTLAGLIPGFIAGAMLVFSALAYAMYWHDKNAAQRGGRRTAETTLLLAGLVGGWPGALVAQQQFRHKTIKQPFQTGFWLTVVINLACVAWLARSAMLAAKLQ